MDKQIDFSAVPQVAAALVAAIFQPRRVSVDVVHLPAGLAGATAGEALQQDVEVDVDQQGGPDGHPELGQHGVPVRLVGD